MLTAGLGRAAEIIAGARLFPSVIGRLCVVFADILLAYLLKARRERAATLPAVTLSRMPIFDRRGVD